MSEPLPLRCMNWPTDDQTKRARKFGEGFTWTCPECGEVLVLAQGKGDHWFWQNPTIDRTENPA